MNSQTLSMLKRLQAAEIKLAETRQAKETAERQVERYKRRLAESDAQIEEKQEALTVKRDALDAHSREIAARDKSLSEHLEASEAEEAGPKSATLVRAINREKAELNRLEQSRAQLEQAVKFLQKQRTETERQRCDIAEKLTSAKRSLSRSSRADRRALQHEEEVEETCARQVEAGVLDVFLAAARLHDGEGLAKLTKPHPQRGQYTCSGCHMCVSLEAIDSLKRPAAVSQCNVCGRILYVNGRDGK
jgi:predicted  nucleic acid-binding Zn-ribbon protein